MLNLTRKNESDETYIVGAYHSNDDKDIIVVWITSKPLSDSSIQSSIDNSQYITVTDNFKDQIVTD